MTTYVTVRAWLCTNKPDRKAICTYGRAVLFQYPPRVGENIRFSDRFVARVADLTHHAGGNIFIELRPFTASSRADYAHYDRLLREHSFAITAKYIEDPFEEAPKLDRRPSDAVNEILETNALDPDDQAHTIFAEVPRRIRDHGRSVLNLGPLALLFSLLVSGCTLTGASQPEYSAVRLVADNTDITVGESTQVRVQLVTPRSELIGQSTTVSGSYESTGSISGVLVDPNDLGRFRIRCVGEGVGKFHFAVDDGPSALIRIYCVAPVDPVVLTLHEELDEVCASYHAEAATARNEVKRELVAKRYLKQANAIVRATNLSNIRGTLRGFDHSPIDDGFRVLIASTGLSFETSWLDAGYISPRSRVGRQVIEFGPNDCVAFSAKPHISRAANFMGPQLLGSVAAHMDRPGCWGPIYVRFTAVGSCPIDKPQDVIAMN